MRSPLLAAALLASAGASNLYAQAPALDGAPYIHDPSTIAISDGKYFTFGTGGGGLISEDGWTWNGGAQRPGGGAAPDVLKIGDRYLVAYGSTGGGLGGGHNGTIHTMWTKSLDPKSPDLEFVEDTVVASTDGFEDCDAIDPSLLLGPDNRLWLSYGTYFGFIRMVELDPKTGKRKPGNQPVNVAIDMEASSLQYRDGWYYLLGTHGTCCDGANSTYNIRVGRSKSPTGPFVDHMGTDLLRGGGKLVVAASGRFVGAGHFGRLVITEGIEKFSCHYEADLDRSGRSVLDIRPLLWRDGWPYAGDNVWEGTYQIQSERSGGALELGVDFVRMERTGGFFGRGAPQTPPTPVAGAGALAGRGRLARRTGRRPDRRLHGPPPPEVDHFAGFQCRRLSGFALLQDRHRRHEPRARRHCGPGSGRGSGVHGRSGATLAHRPADRRDLSHHAQASPGDERAARAHRCGRQQSDAFEVRPEERKIQVELAQAVTATAQRG